MEDHQDAEEKAKDEWEEMIPQDTTVKHPRPVPTTATITATATATATTSTTTSTVNGQQAETMTASSSSSSSSSTTTTTSSTTLADNLDNDVVVTAVQQLLSMYQQRLWSVHQKRIMAQDKFKLVHEERERLDIKFHNPDLVFRNSRAPLTDDEYDAHRKVLALSRQVTEDLFVRALQEENDLRQQITTIVGAAQIQQQQQQYQPSV